MQPGRTSDWGNPAWTEIFLILHILFQPCNVWSRNPQNPDCCVNLLCGSLCMSPPSLYWTKWNTIESCQTRQEKAKQSAMLMFVLGHCEAFHYCMSITSIMTNCPGRISYCPPRGHFHPTPVSFGGAKTIKVPFGWHPHNVARQGKCTITEPHRCNWAFFRNLLFKSPLEWLELDWGLSVHSQLSYQSVIQCQLR